MNCSPPGSSIHGISQARILEWVAISFSRDLPYPGIPVSPALAGGFFITEPPAPCSPRRQRKDHREGDIFLRIPAEAISSGNELPVTRAMQLGGRKLLLSVPLSDFSTLPFPDSGPGDQEGQIQGPGMPSSPGCSCGSPPTQKVTPRKRGFTGAVPTALAQSNPFHPKSRKRLHPHRVQGGEWRLRAAHSLSERTLLHRSSSETYL